jgi:hypothetical protein
MAPRKPTLLITGARLAAMVIGMTLNMTHAASPDKTTGINACSLLSTEELSRLFNGPVRRPRAETAEKGTACQFAVAGANTLNIPLWPTSVKLRRV